MTGTSEGWVSLLCLLIRKLRGKKALLEEKEDRGESDISCVVFHDQAFVDLQRNLCPFGK